MGTTHEDLTGRARLRDAAIESFAAAGFDESLRAIAIRAGVSAGLVRHHFGSKEKLRAECDATGPEFFERLVAGAQEFSKDAVARGIVVPSRNSSPVGFAAEPASR